MLHALEADLALQRQIYEASRRLSLEEHLSKSVRKSRLQQCKRELKKMKEMQEAVLKQSSKRDCVSPQTRRTSRQRGKTIRLTFLCWVQYIYSRNSALIIDFLLLTASHCR